MTTFSPCLDQIDKNHATIQAIRPLSDAQLNRNTEPFDVFIQNMVLEAQKRLYSAV